MKFSASNEEMVNDYRGSHSYLVHQVNTGDNLNDIINDDCGTELEGFPIAH